MGINVSNGIGVFCSYYINPLAWTLYGIIVTQLGDETDVVSALCRQCDRAQCCNRFLHLAMQSSGSARAALVMTTWACDNIMATTDCVSVTMHWQLHASLHSYCITSEHPALCYAYECGVSQSCHCSLQCLHVVNCVVHFSARALTSI